MKNIPSGGCDSFQMKISVLTVCFNSENTIRDTIESFLSQDYPDKEMLVIDGGSTDGTGAFLESLGTGVSWISEPDDGIADAMNKGVRLARGERLELVSPVHAENQV